MVLKNNNCFLSIPYLQAIEKTFKSELDFCFLTVLDKKQEPILIASFQLVPFIFKGDNQPPKILSHCSKRKNGFFMLQMLVCGSVFGCGAHGFQKSDAIDEITAFAILGKGMKKVQKLLSKQTNKKISVQMFKEYSPENRLGSDFLESKGYQDFEIDVNMAMPISANWNTMEQYFEIYKAKFRTKANSVFAKASSVRLVSFSSSEILKHQDLINGLFANVQGKSEYQFGVMTAKGFAAIKENLKDNFIFRAAFIDTTLVGFSTSFVNQNVLEANYVGIDYSKNIEYSIYQRLLYDYVALAIENKVLSLQFGRTSELLKSSLGATPLTMKLYAKHTSKITHLLMASILKKVSPSSFELRKPFKKIYYND